MPTLKGYEYRVRGYAEPGHIVARTASKARARVWRDLGDCCDGIRFQDISIKRDPSGDMHFPEMPEVNAGLTDRDRDVILNAYGGGSHLQPHQWGYRDHQCVAPTDPTLSNLRDLGLFSGPHGVDANGNTPGWVGAFWYLTDAGKELARALIGAREAS